MNPQSLNKYSYCFNNTLKYNDPTGHWPNWSKIGHAIASAAKAVVNVVKENINVIQTALDVAGMIPVIGEICDVASGIISVAKGDWAGAALSLASAVPVVGNVAGGAKIVKNVVKLVDRVDDITDAARAIDKAGDVAKNVERGAQNPIVKNALIKGQLAHKVEDYGANVIKEFRLPSGKHIDAFDPVKKIIYELKPNNPQAISRGYKQLYSYVQEVNRIGTYGTGYKGVLRTYK
jgi:hypothetical protein